MSQTDANANEAEARFDIVRERYGDRLGSDELEEVRKGVEGIVRAAEAMRAIHLDNGDEPFTVFAPYRGEE